MGIDMLFVASQLEKRFAVRLSLDQFSAMAMRNDPPDIMVGELFDVVRGEVPQSGVLDVDLDSDALWPIYRRADLGRLGRRA